MYVHVRARRSALHVRRLNSIQIHLCPDLQNVCVRVRIRHRIISSDQVNQLIYRIVIHNDVKTVHTVPVHV